MTLVHGDAAIDERAATPQAPLRVSPSVVPGIVHGAELLYIAGVGLLLCSVAVRDTPHYFSQHVFSVFFIAVCFAYISSTGSLASINALMRPGRQVDNLIIAIGTSFLFLLSVIYGFDVAYMFDPLWLLYFAGAVTFGILLTRVLAFLTLSMLSRRHLIGRNLAILGANEQSERVLRQITRDRPYFTEVAGIFAAGEGERSGSRAGLPVIGDTETLLAKAREGLIDDIIVTRSSHTEHAMSALIDRLKELPVNVYLVSDLADFNLTFRPILGVNSQVPLFEVTQRPIAGWSSAAKRLLDYSLAVVGLIALSPLLLLVALAIKLDSPGPIFFNQQRLGFNNRPFAIYKFRSMYHRGTPEERVRQATRGDPRVTRVGRIIRATSIDELPQLLNVLDGTMSLVGPRPHAVSHNEEYGAKIRGYFARHKVKPGLTGWAQVNGLRGETVDVEKMRARVEHDVYYTENWSIFFDIKIIVLTVFVVLRQKTAY